MQEYARTYKIEGTTVHIVAPAPKSKEEIDRILKDYHQAGWEIIMELMEKSKKSCNFSKAFMK
ncbi:hypothetical protein [Geosporobacter ferrireducens]|uniref:Uncharacterized protein n=1 Tax=Geosporobacter ferrireducens TaxID=1424294 RepID=A0A1D8GPN5_9FIRM|nr:hypothetical protein [Geosporobacter ferrireducens]AOT72896.1 hypothetical protein Gferi_27065 [Geosporobacter ferrireducens]MTI55301.1 hypothetical protein [Geosporobacter ferrireducens]